MPGSVRRGRASPGTPLAPCRGWTRKGGEFADMLAAAPSLRSRQRRRPRESSAPCRQRHADWTRYRSLRFRATCAFDVRSHMHGASLRPDRRADLEIEGQSEGSFPNGHRHVHQGIDCTPAHLSSSLWNGRPAAAARCPPTGTTRGLGIARAFGARMSTARGLLFEAGHPDPAFVSYEDSLSA